MFAAVRDDERSRAGADLRRFSKLSKFRTHQSRARASSEAVSSRCPSALKPCRAHSPEMLLQYGQARARGGGPDPRLSHPKR